MILGTDYTDLHGSVTSCFRVIETSRRLKLMDGFREIRVIRAFKK